MAEGLSCDSFILCFAFCILYFVCAVFSFQQTNPWLYMVGRRSSSCDGHVDDYDDAYDHNSDDGGMRKRQKTKVKSWGPEASLNFL